jgi:hypothetical protein
MAQNPKSWINDMRNTEDLLFPSYTTTNSQGGVFIAAGFDTLEGVNWQVTPRKAGNKGALVKFNEDGNYQWHKGFEVPNGSFTFHGLKAVQGSMVGVLVSVSPADKATLGEQTVKKSGLYLLTYKNDGRFNDIRLLGQSPNGGFSPWPYDFHVDQKGNVILYGLVYKEVILGGDTVSTLYEGDDFIHAFVAKLDDANDLEFARVFGGNNFDHPQAIHHEEPTGNLYVYGRFNEDPLSGDPVFQYEEETFTNYGGNDLYVLKLDENGKKLWLNVLGGSGDDRAAGFTKSGDAIYLSGTYENAIQLGDELINSSFQSSAFLAKMGTSGKFQWAQSFDTDGRINATKPILNDERLYLGINFGDQLVFNDAESIDHPQYDTSGDNAAVLALNTSGEFESFMPISSKKNAGISKLMAHPTYSDHFITWLFYEGSVQLNDQTLDESGMREVLWSTNFSDVDQNSSTSDRQAKESAADLYPTIITGRKLHLKLPGRSANKAFEGRIMDMSGKVYKQTNFNKGDRETAIHLPASLSSGIYFLSLRSDNYQETLKFFKQ